MAKMPTITARLITDTGQVAQLLDDLVRRLERVERKLDRVLAAVVDEEDLESCPHCGNPGTEEVPLEDTSVMGEPTRMTCHACGKSWRPDDQA